ncbi:MAG: hypothetical protein MUF00_11205 [Gemmatimonadaceae bacterium]|jgi:hypothetical protein|nr:hypothetical protein [Gemmatimonadaceae bacterium]
MSASRLARLCLAAALVTSAAQAQTTRRFVVSIDGHQRPIALDTMGVRMDFPNASPGQVWTQLTAVYDEAKIITNVRDSTAGEIGNLTLVQRGRLWKQPMSRFFDCGTSMSGNNADSYKVSLALLSWIVPNGAGSTVWTAVAAGGRDLSGTSNHSRTCQSLGQLEGTIHDALRERLKVRVTEH